MWIIISHTHTIINKKDLTGAQIGTEAKEFKMYRNCCVMLTILLAVCEVRASLPATKTIKRLGSVDLGIIAETTPIVWKNELWLMECIQGKKYYGNLDGKSYIRFTNPFTGVRSPHLAVGYGLGNAVVENGTIYVFATKTPYGISTNNTEVSVFWSKDLMSKSWNSAVVFRANDNGVIPNNCSGKKALWNTCVQKGVVSGKLTFLMAYEYNCGGPGWQTHFAVGESISGANQTLSSYKWSPIPFENESEFLKISHANPTIRWNKNDGYWYLMSTRGANGILVEDIYRTTNPLDFLSWKAPKGWSISNPLDAPLIAPSSEDQAVSPIQWHPDTKAVVEGNRTAVKKAKNINTSDLDLCTATIDGKVSTVLYWAWGDQMLGPTAMVLCVGVVEGKAMEEFLSSFFDA